MACDWLLIDGSSLIFRAFHGIPRTVRSPDGHPVNAVRGFMDALARLVSTRQPRHLAVAGDADWRPAWRVELIPGYKAHRTAEPVPPELAPQMPLIDEVLDSNRWSEADLVARFEAAWEAYHAAPSVACSSWAGGALAALHSTSTA